MRPSPSLLSRRLATFVFPHWLSPACPHSRHAISRTPFRPRARSAVVRSAVARGPSSLIRYKTIRTQHRASPESHSAPHPGSRQTLTATSSAFVAFVAFLGIGLGLGWSAVNFRRKRASDLSDLGFPEEESGADSMSGEIAPGRPGNLTPEQEEKLRRLWQLIFQVCGVRRPENGAEATDAAVAPAPTPASPEKTEKAKKGRMSIFRRGRKDSEGHATPAPTSPAASVVLTQSKDGEDDKYGQTKHFYDTLASQTPESIRATIWSMVKHDHPDALVLRFLRARKWDVEKALVMLISTMNWRAQEMKVDDEIMRDGDAAAAEAEKDTSDSAKQRLGHDFLQQARMGKSFIHGIDKSGRPICYVRVRLHKQGEQLEESLEKYTVYVIETCRYLLQPPVDTATIVFDMTGFSLANMDYTPVKFMIKCFEANYPESLGAVLVHKAPWVFQGIWKVIRGWLDPVVANKVHFTNNVKEMEEFIPTKHILKELEGEEDWEYTFVEPIPGENAKMQDVQTRNRLLAARELLVKDFEDATQQWIQHPDDEQAAEIKARRAALAAKLREDYWNLDPYLRARSYYDRTGVLQPGGTVDFYPTPKKPESEKVAEITNGVAAVAIQTSADDVD